MRLAAGDTQPPSNSRFNTFWRTLQNMLLFRVVTLHELHGGQVLRRYSWFIAGLGILFALCGWAWASEPAPLPPTPAAGPVMRLDVEGIIDPILARYVERGLVRAHKANASLVLIVIDTPGGLDPSMRRITKSLLNASMPTLVYVHPAGARAASAGAFIGMAATYLALTPGTNIGAAHPVDLQGTKASAKVTNDAAAYLLGLARQRGRNENVADRMVRESLSLPAEEALQQQVADFTAQRVDDLLRQLGEKNPSLGLASGQTVQNIDLRPTEELLHALSNPNLTYVLFLLGVYGLLYELASPGAILPGVAGAICLLLALMGFEALPLSLTGLLLLALGAVLLLLEAFVVSHGILAAGGAVALILGSFMLFPSDLPSFRLATSVLATMIGLTVAYVMLFAVVALRLRRRPAISGMESLVGAPGVVTAKTVAGAIVHVAGDDWLVTRDSGELAQGQAVVVEAAEGLRLKVRPQPPEKNS
jgi:membrane-bound serine protease (ClpP class)